jgi:D-alanyl-D-alanine carboxypeptidase
MFWDNQEIWDELKKDRTKYWTPEEVLEYIDEPYFKAGEGWRYSNTNYLLLAMIINKATGSNLSTELNDRFYQPLGLSDFYLSQEESLPAHQAHVYSDNFEPGEPIRDVTFAPRTSHESITYGSSGIFTTPENLARWSHALFEGRILEEQSMNAMLTFIKFRPVSNMRAYGLGVEDFTRNISCGQRAIGHSGGNIGTTTYMIYLPEQHVSVVVMINAFPNDAAEVITKGIIWILLKDLDAFEIIPFIGANFFYFIVAICAVVVGINVITYIIRKKRKMSLKDTLE